VKGLKIGLWQAAFLQPAVGLVGKGAGDFAFLKRGPNSPLQRTSHRGPMEFSGQFLKGKCPQANRFKDFRLGP
jgi:hypothetical protein